MPSAAEVASIAEAAGFTLAATIVDAADARIELLSHDDDLTVTGWQTETSGTMTAVRATWTWESHTRGARPQALTIIHITVGGRLGGEGWAEQSQYLVPGQLSGEEARLLAALAAQGSLPVLVGREEL